MPKLIVQLKQKTVQELDLTGDRVVIGRGEENAVKLDDNLASREHAEIREENGRYLLSDLGSANGTYVGGKKIASGHELKDGDIIKISPYTILFRMAAREKPTQVGMVETGEKPTEVFTFSGTPRLLVRSGAEVGKSYDLTNNPLLGRGEDSDIVLNEGSVSRKHARIQFIENKLTIVDVGSRSGTRVNGKLIDKPTPLKDGDRVQLGEASLEVEWKGGAGAPKAEAEKATVPFFRPDLAPARREAQWWKWAVGIAAGLIVIFAVYWIIRPPRGRDRGQFKSDAMAHFKRGADSSDSGKLDTALAEIDSAIRKGAGEEERGLKRSIEQRISEKKFAEQLAAQAGQALTGGNVEAAVGNADAAYGKDSVSSVVRKARAAAYKTRAQYRDSRGESGEALSDWKVVAAMDPNDQDALRRLAGAKPSPLESDRVRRGGPPPPLPFTPYDRALAAYHDGLTAETRAAVDRLVVSAPNDIKALELKGWMGLEDEATYLLDVKGDTAAAKEKFGVLVRQDPGNLRVQARLQALVSKPSIWNSQKANDLFRQAEQDYLRWKDYGEQEFKDKAIKGYQEIVKMGPPPKDAAQEDLNIYNTAKQKSAE